jgi:hypothetical protein
LGDVGLQAEYWLNDPTRPSLVSGSIGLGFVAPTGRDGVTGLGPNGDRPIDEALQTGNGGWHILLKAQGTARIAGPLFGYASGWYGMSLTEKTQLMMAGTNRGVPDLYSGRLGAAYLLPVLEGLVLSAGGRINGVTVRDVVGGGDLYWRRPGYEVYFEPGLTWTLGRNLASISVPIRIYQNKLDSLYDTHVLGEHVGADFASYLISVSYARRF